MKYQIVFLVSLACALYAVEAVPTKVCEPGAVFMVECNSCKCNTDGTDMACTRKSCIGNEKGEPEMEQNDEAAKEEHKEEHHCGKNKNQAENENNDEHKEDEHKEEEHKEDAEHCVPGTTFKKDCNDCTCPPSGLKSAGACTLLACLDDEIQKD